MDQGGITHLVLTFHSPGDGPGLHHEEGDVTVTKSADGCEVVLSWHRHSLIHHLLQLEALQLDATQLAPQQALELALVVRVVVVRPLVERHRLQALERLLPLPPLGRPYLSWRCLYGTGSPRPCMSR